MCSQYAENEYLILYTNIGKLWGGGDRGERAGGGGSGIYAAID